MEKSISHSFEDESLEAKAAWFASLPLAERMEMLCSFTDLILENNPKIADLKYAQPSSKRVLVLSIV